MKSGIGKTIRGSQSPDIVDSVHELRAKYGKYAVPDDEARELVDKAMGRKTLSEELRVIREASRTQSTSRLGV